MNLYYQGNIILIVKEVFRPYLLDALHGYHVILGPLVAVVR